MEGKAKLIFFRLFHLILILTVTLVFNPCAVKAYPLGLGLVPVTGKELHEIASTQPNGSLQMDASGKVFQFKCKLMLKDLAGSKDVDHAFEDLDMFLNLSMTGELGEDSLRGSWVLKAAWPKGQFLFFPWFFDLSQIKGSLSARGKVADKRLTIEKMRVYGPFSFEAEGITLPCKASNKAGKGCIYEFLGARWQFMASIGRLYNLLVKDAFSDSHPVVRKFEPEGKVKAWGEKKRVGLDIEANVLFKEKVLLDGLSARVFYPLRADRCEQGLVRWKGIFLGALIPKEIFKSPSKIRLAGRELPVTICEDRASFGPLTLDTGNGTISLQKASFLFSRGTLNLKGLRLDKLKIHQLLKAVPISVSVDGYLPDAHFVGDRLVFSGEVKVHIADGLVTIKNIWLEPYAAIFRWGADISFKHINLKKLSEKTSFGLVTGAVKGWVKDLVMSGGQPEQFDLLIKTDESVDVPKKISIKAIENLSILGGGGGSVSFLGQLFKEFSYSKIGISCRLKNDIFELHGLYKKGNKEYLVKRGFFGGVNVINMNPKGKISFRDMLDRLERIGESSQSKVEVK